MSGQVIQEQHQYIVSLLKQKRLKEAQIQLEAYLSGCNDWTLRDRLEQAQTAYRYMLQYMQQGVDDPGRQVLHRQLITETWEIADQIRLCLLDGVSDHYYHSLRNNRNCLPEKYDIANFRNILESFPDDIAVCQLMPNNQGLDAILERHEQTLRMLFLHTWCNSAWSSQEKAQAKEMLHSELLPVNDLCLFTSAVTLSLIECFDARKFAWLLSATQHQADPVNQRALVGIAIVIHIHSSRLSYYPELTARLSLLNESDNFKAQFNRIYIQLLRSQETEKIDRKMREEIIPEMIKNVSLMRNIEFGPDDNAADENDPNPDWEKAFEQSGLGDKIREMSELQMSGADVYMSSFAQLKNFPFFKEPHNWFYPFDMHHSVIIKEFGFTPTEENTFLSLILQSGFFCDSDKYSLCFTLTHVPKAQRERMLSQMTSQDMNELMDEQKSLRLQKYAKQLDVISNQYIHNLYRFFKLYQRKNEFRDIFKENIELHKIPALQETLGDPPLHIDLAEFHFSQGHYAKALELYRSLTKDQYTTVSDVYRKIGYCLQKEKRYKEAIDAYISADMEAPDHLWTLRHLATCYRHIQDFGHALEYYKKVEAIQPENLNILSLIGGCLAELERYEEALQYFFKLDFLENNCLKAWRPIAWCSFITGKYEQAMKYYRKILADQPLAADYLNAGHVTWVSGDTSKATKLYSKAAEKYGDREAFMEMFNKDLEILIKQGIDRNDIPLMLDMI